MNTYTAHDTRVRANHATLSIADQNEYRNSKTLCLYIITLPPLSHYPYHHFLPDLLSARFP